MEQRRSIPKGRKYIIRNVMFPKERIFNIDEKLKYKRNNSHNNKNHRIILTNQKTPRYSLNYIDINAKKKKHSVISSEAHSKIEPNKINKEYMIEAERRVMEKKSLRLLNQLSKERSKLKKSLLLIKDSKALSIISNKVTEINKQVSRIMRELNGNVTPSKKENNYYRQDSYKKNLEDISFTSMKEDMKKIDNNLKLGELIHDFNLLEITNVEGVIKDKPSFLFQRNKNISLYTPSTSYGLNTNLGNRTTLFVKGLKPFGFRKIEKQAIPVSQSNTFEDVFFDATESQKLNDSNNIKIKKKETKDDFFCLSSARTRPKTVMTNERSCQTSKNARHKNFIDNKIETIINNTKIIKDTIKLRINEERKAFIKAKETTLSNFRAKLPGYNCEDYLENLKRKPLMSVEECFIDELGRIPKSVKKIFREAFKKILSEDRLLHKRDPRIEDPFVKKLRFIKEQKDFQKETFRTMYLLRENIADGKEDDIFEVNGDLNDFENVETLKWLIKKKNLLKKNNNNLGAYNPKEKLNLLINYP